MTSTSEIIIVVTICVIALGFAILVLTNLFFKGWHLEPGIKTAEEKLNLPPTPIQEHVEKPLVVALDKVSAPEPPSRADLKNAANKALKDSGILLMQNDKLNKIYFYKDPESEGFLRTDHWTPNELLIVAQYISAFPEIVK